MSHANRRRTRKPRYGPLRRNPPGTPPGTLTVDPEARRTALQLFVYSPDHVTETSKASFEQVEAARGANLRRWINVDGLGDAEALRRLGAHFGLHPLALEDVVNLHQRAKVEDYGDHLFLILRMPPAMPAAQAPPSAGVPGPQASVAVSAPEGGVHLQTEQVAIILGSDFVATFQEHPGDCFDPVRRRLRSEASQIRRQGPDYLAYALVDAVVDAYFPLLEHYGERVEELENEVVAHPGPDQIRRIHDLKRDLLALRRAVWPMRDLLAALLRDDTALIEAHTRIYLRDCHDHVIQLIDMIETYREIASGLVDIHLSSVSNRMNEVMKVLTIIATIFIPLTFIAGVYGMNFDPEAGPLNMPELGWRFGYPAVMLAMAAIALALVLWFRRKGWMGGPGRRD